MSVIIDGVKQEYIHGRRVLDIAGDNKDIIACKIDNKLRDLNYAIEDNKEIKLLGFEDEDSVRVYESSLRYLVVMAIHNVFPKLGVNCDYYISRSICFRLNEGKFNEEQFNKIKQEMARLVKEDYPFIRETLSVKEAYDYYKNNGFDDKVEVFKYRNENEDTHMYKCDTYKNYMYSYMVPSTGYLTKYNLILYKGMIILQYPRAENGGNIPCFSEEETYERTLQESSEWGKEVGSLTVAGINNNVTTDYKGFIEKCEKRHADCIDEIVEKIKQKKTVSLIAIAGPSSSGKTTFSNKLRIGLEKIGIYPVKISMDDYYLDRSDLSPEEEKKVDYEDINLIDIPLFNQHLKELSEGKEVTLPRFDFRTKKRVVGKTIKLEKNCPIIIEGIHALNKKLTASIAPENKFKIYIGPHIQINIDNHTPISITHLRLVRRIVRDYRCRGTNVNRTLRMWNSVRRGEFKWIYDNQEGVDYVYNSVLDYEFCIMKKHVLPLLMDVEPTSEHYNLSKTLIKYFKYFVDIDDEDVPYNSLLREFIGDSCFSD